MSSNYYCSTQAFLSSELTAIIDQLTKSDAASGFLQLSHNQIESWRKTIEYTKDSLRHSSHLDTILGVVFEYRIPRREKRIDCAIITNNDVIIIEYKSGSSKLNSDALTQGVDYGLDILNYHAASRNSRVHVIICPTEYNGSTDISNACEKMASLQVCGKDYLASAIDKCVGGGQGSLTLADWVNSRYNPVPGILEAVNILFARCELGDIKECLSSSSSLERMIKNIQSEIVAARTQSINKLLLVSGVPGSGKTLVGLKLAHITSMNGDDRFAFMSGNGPLLKVLRASLARGYAKEKGCTLSDAKRYSEAMLHSVHSFIEEGRLTNQPPVENVVIFDEAQRAWSQSKMQKMNTRQRKYNNTNDIEHPEGCVYSEPETLLGIMGRKEGGSVIVALCGNGQEIHDGEAGIDEWIRSGLESNDWDISTSPEISRHLIDASLAARLDIQQDLHLDIPLRSHRAQDHSKWVDSVLKGNSSLAKKHINNESFPIFVTRSLEDARQFLEESVLGSRRYGLLASSSAGRLRPYGIEVSAEFRKGVDYPLWFTAPSNDFRSSYALESVATEFEVQGLEIDWAVLAWSWDLVISENRIHCQSLRGAKWTSITDDEKIMFLKNKYRVLLTRSREGMVIFIPKGSKIDKTRSPEEMDDLEDFFVKCGAKLLNTHTSEAQRNSASNDLINVGDL